MRKPKIKISLVDKKGPMGCHHGHQIGDTWDWDTERGALCPMAQHVAFPYVDILRYGGQLPGKDKDSICICCPDVDVINVFKIEKAKDE
ncbi:MAG: TIGR04076 family protein [Prevotella sp.]|nr:TIGR04076 family protein [Prevotella sp.]MDY4039252.1 TIGR04076 family protein [Prevotella sp.]